MKTTEAIEAVIKEDGIDSAVEWIAGVVDEKHSRIKTLEKALRDMIEGYEVYDLVDGKPVLRPLERQPSWIKKATAALGEKKDD